MSELFIIHFNKIRLIMNDYKRFYCKDNDS